ncbi:lysophosphatidic acid receptor 5a [Chanos chanos]|uniref:Lysophosphatidic acid receptor 5a n=1 Tax=Chanos chanos TaxID=29144 RepID=A0A6J2VAN9_CHACN|nr:lysophosphatidic acid receptor 6-like [Chanos chanos]
MSCNNATVLNRSCDTSHFRYPLFAGTYSVVLALGLPLNTVALWTFVCRLGLTRSVPVIYMANLAMSDLLFILSLPLRIFYFSTGRWPLGNLACMIPGTLFSVNLYSSSLFITFISVDRLLAVVYPLRSRPLRTVPIAWTICTVVWLAIIALAVPIANNHPANWDKHCEVWRCFENYTEAEWHFGFYILCLVTFLGILVPFVIIVGCTVAVVKELRSQNASSSSSSTAETLLKRYKMVKLFVFNLLIYAVCFIPFHVAFILYGLHKLCFLKYNFFDFQTITLCMASSNSCLDPLIYYFSAMSVQRQNYKVAQSSC